MSSDAAIDGVIAGADRLIEPDDARIERYHDGIEGDDPFIEGDDGVIGALDAFIVGDDDGVEVAEIIDREIARLAPVLDSGQRGRRAAAREDRASLETARFRMERRAQ